MSALVAERHVPARRSGPGGAAARAPVAWAGAARLPVLVATLMRVLMPLLAALLGLAWAAAGAQEIEFHAPASVHEEHAGPALRDLAQRLLPVYQENNVERYLANLSALQLVAGALPAADATRQSLARRRQSGPVRPSHYGAALLDLYVHARMLEARDRIGFDRAFAQTYRDVVSHLDDPQAYAVTGVVPVAPAVLESDVQAIFDARREHGGIPLAEAVELVRAYFTYEAYRRIGGLAAALAAEDERRRYAIDDKVVIRTPDGGRIAALVVRPREAGPPRPALLEFAAGIAPRNFARECAAHGYVGVVAAPRRRGTGPAVPLEREGAQAEAVIAWIARQPWSDGRVAMVGTGYSAYAAWAAAKRAPPALKALAVADAMAPGIDFPMAASVFQNTALRWLVAPDRAGDATAGGAQAGDARAGEATAVDTQADHAKADDAKWQALYRTWYVNGDPSGDLDGFLGQPNPTFHRWLDHPAYDAYWQALIPAGEQFAHVDIPVLSMSGYYAPGQMGALYYFQEHTHFHAHADHTLLVGPYAAGAVAREAPEQHPAVPLDPSADICLRELRYQWLDFVLRGAAKPPLLIEHVNYQVMGADTWRHAPSIAAMSNARLRLYLERGSAPDAHHLAAQAGSENGYVRQSVDLADRGDADTAAVNGELGPNVSPRLILRNDLVFVSEPFPQAVELGGVLAGRLDFLINKRDVDLTVALYEQLADGQYLRLFGPPYAFRASHAADRQHRHLLQSGIRQQLDLRGEHLSSRMIQSGSRLVFVLGVNKCMDQEINLGTGRSVREEYVETAGPPMEIRWYGSSYIEVPVRQ